MLLLYMVIFSFLHHGSFIFFHVFSISKMTEDDANIESSQFTLFAPIYKAYSIQYQYISGTEMISPLSALTSLPHKGKIIKIRVLIKKHLKHFLRCLVDMIGHSWTPVCSYAAYTQHRPALCNDCPSVVLSSCQALCTPCLWCLN